MASFDEILLRLKQRLRLQADKEVAAALGMADKAFNARKKRGAFPVDKLLALKARQPELGIDTDYILTGNDKRFDARLDALRIATAKAMAIPLPSAYQVLLRDVLFAMELGDAMLVKQLLDAFVASGIPTEPTTKSQQTRKERR